MVGNYNIVIIIIYTFIRVAYSIYSFNGIKYTNYISKQKYI